MTGEDSKRSDVKAGGKVGQRSVKKQVIEHLDQLDFLHGRQNVILLGPPGTGRQDPSGLAPIRVSRSLPRSR
jgi:hypothetical protein